MSANGKFFIVALKGGKLDTHEVPRAPDVLEKLLETDPEDYVIVFGHRVKSDLNMFYISLGGESELETLIELELRNRARQGASGGKGGSNEERPLPGLVP